jgi:hypothetical protein
MAFMNKSAESERKDYKPSNPAKIFEKNTAAAGRI